MESASADQHEVAGEVTVATDHGISSLISSSLHAVHGPNLASTPSTEEPHLATTATEGECCTTTATTTTAVQSVGPSCDLSPTATTTTAVQSLGPSCDLSPSQSDNNSPVSSHPLGLLPPNPTPSPCPPTGDREPPRKRSKTSGGVKHGNIEVVLEGKNLWDEFYCRGTEMIVNRAGRRMFPGFAVAISGLKPKAKYSMKLDVVLADNHRFKFLNARWLAVGTAEPQPLSETYVHPDSPNTGAFWTRHGVSFRKLKITNNKERPGNNALLHSMHKYFIRLVVEEERKTPPGEERLPSRTVLSTDFPETTFIAVTAYQNEEVTQLKITNNPFAKAFRENADMDWETAQMLYGNQAIYSPHTYTDSFGVANHLVAPGSWPLHSPLLPPTPITASLQPLSPLTGMTAHHPGSYLSPSPFRYDPSTPSHYFQWPQVPTHRMPLPQEHFQYPQHKPLYPHPSSHAHSSSNLPDFDSVFTPPIAHSSS